MPNAPGRQKETGSAALLLTSLFVLHDNSHISCDKLSSILQSNCWPDHDDHGQGRVKAHSVQGHVNRRDLCKVSSSLCERAESNPDFLKDSQCGTADCLHSQVALADPARFLTTLD